MATSAIGPGFINNTALFTQQLGSSFGFIILAALVLDIIVQLSVWLTIGLKGKYAQQIANETIPGSGHFLSVLIATGGFVFNIGNMAGCVLGLQIIFGLPMLSAALISMAVSLAVLLAGRSGRALELFCVFLGIIMIILMLQILFQLKIPFREAITDSFLPKEINLPILLTIMGGTVGGYISFAGAHHLVDSGISDFRKIRQGAVRGIVITSVMRYLLFLVALAAIATGLEISKDNPAASVFSVAGGAWSEKIFGVILWAASITSVVGSSYTSFSFVKTLHPLIGSQKKIFLSLFITASSLFLLIAGKPVKLLVFAGAFNGIILPLALIIILSIIFKNRKLPYWRFAWWISIPGWLVTAGLIYMSYEAILKILN